MATAILFGLTARAFGAGGQELFSSMIRCLSDLDDSHQRRTAHEKGKYAEIKAATYTDEDYERINTMEDSIRKFNYIGDTQFLNGEVVGKREQDGRFRTDIQMTMINQRDTETRSPKQPSLASRASGIGVSQRFRSILSAKLRRCMRATTNSTHNGVPAAKRVHLIQSATAANIEQ